MHMMHGNVLLNYGAILDRHTEHRLAVHQEGQNARDVPRDATLNCT